MNTVQMVDSLAGHVSLLECIQYMFFSCQVLPKSATSSSLDSNTGEFKVPNFCQGGKGCKDINNPVILRERFGARDDMFSY